MEAPAPLSVPQGITRRPALECLNSLPVMTVSASRVLAQLAHRHCDVADVAALIEKDSVLSAQLMQTANSAAFKRSQQVESVRHAVVMVGLGSVRRFALARTIANLFSRSAFPPGFSLARFNLHSVAVGTMMELLADEVPLEDRESAFLSGLLHDVGKLLIAVFMPDRYNHALEVAAITGDSLLACETAVLGTNHAELSALALNRWGLPESVETAAAFHHHPDSITPSQDGRHSRVPLSLAVNQTDLVIKALGMAVEPPRLIADPVAAMQFDGFELDQPRLLERFAFEWRTTDALFR